MMTATQSIAVARARLVSHREPERARRILMSAGFHWRVAGILVLTARRQHRKANP